MKRPLIALASFALMTSACFQTAPVQAAVRQTIFSDQLSIAPMSSAKWKIPTWVSPTDGTYLGRTQFRCTQDAGLPTIEGGFARIALGTYNPGGRSFYGTDLIAKKSLTPAKGILVTVAAQAQSPFPRGIVAGIFLYALKPGSNTLHDEIDFELLGNSPQYVQTNIYANAPLGAGNWKLHRFSTGSATALRKYQILWQPDKVAWLIDGKTIRTVTNKSLIPKGPMFLHLNIWAPASEWAEAYSPALQPATSAAGNKNYFLKVDSVQIETLY